VFLLAFLYSSAEALVFHCSMLIHKVFQLHHNILVKPLISVIRLCGTCDFFSCCLYTLFNCRPLLLHIRIAGLLVVNIFCNRIMVLLYTCTILKLTNVTSKTSSLACWPLVPKIAGSNPAEAVGFFPGVKNPEHAFLCKGSKAVGPVSYIYGM
jgi:hypothetical protein